MLSSLVLALLAGSVHGSNLSAPLPLWGDWLAPPAIASAPASISTNAVVLGSGKVTIPAELCFSVFSAPAQDCPAWEQVGCETSPIEGSVTAPGTLLWAPLRDLTCCNRTTTVTIAPQQCAAGVLALPSDVAGAEHSVGTISQLYYPHVQAVVAGFLDIQSPYMMPVAGAVCGFAYGVYIYAGHAAVGAQTVLDALRAAYLGSMVVSGAHGLYHMMANGIDRYDLATQAAEVAALTLGAVCYCKEGAMRTAVGDPRVRCLCSRAAWGAGGYALTGNLGAVFSVVQGAVNAAWREARLDGGTRVANVRAPRP